MNTEPTTAIALASLPTISRELVYKSGGVEDVVSALEREVRAIPRDVTTPQGRKAIASLANKVARSKTALDEMGKSYTDELRAQASQFHEDRRIIRERLDALKLEVRAPLTAYEEREERRVAAHEKAIKAIAETPGYGQVETTDELDLRLSHLRAYPERDWEEFEQLARNTIAAEIERTEALRTVAQDREEVARAEAERQAQAAAEAAAQAERDRVAREARIAEEAAQHAREQAEARAEQERQAEAARVAQEREAAEKAAREAADAAAARELKAEQERVAAREAAQRAEQARIDAEARAERARQEGIEAEQARVAQLARETAAENERRARDRQHKARCNIAAASAFMKCGLSEDVARLAVKAIIRGEVPRVTLTY